MKRISAFGMLNRKQMRKGELASFIAIILLLFTLTAEGIHGRKKTDQLSPENLLDLANINEDMAEVLWINCGLELMYAKEPIENIELNGLEERFTGSNDIISKDQLLGKENPQSVGSVLDPAAKQILLECIRKKNLMLLVSGEERGFKFWFTKYLESWFAQPEAHRQRELIQSFAEVPAPSPAVASPAPRPASLSDLAPSSSELPNAQSPARHPPLPFFPPFVNDSSPPPADGEHSSAIPPSTSDAYTNKQKASRKTVVVAVVVTASVTFVLVALLFLFYHRLCGVGSRIGQNDEKPLISLSLSNYSIGSSQKSFAMGISNNEEKLSNLSPYTSSKHKIMASSSDGNLYLNSDNVNASRVETSPGCLSGSVITLSADSCKGSSSPMEPPPGVLGTFGQPSLKLPPGRLDLSETPSPKKAAPTPPPPPPVPLPSVKPSSCGPCPPRPGQPPPPPMPSGIKAGLPPPPPPSIAPPRPPPFGLKPAQASTLGPDHPSTSASTVGGDDALKPKLKPFFWDKVLANPNHSMVWHQIKSGSFQFNEEMIETLFGYTPAEKRKNESKKESSSQDPSIQYIQIIDPKKSQNLLILLKALNVTTEEVCVALQEGNELPPEFLQTLLKMAPTAEEELKLRHYTGDLSQLGPAEQFLKVLVEIPFAFKRLESLLFMYTLREEASMVKESFSTLEAACTELRRSRLFLKLLEAVLKTGNRMNDGTFRGGAQAFKLDTLLKLADVKGTDGKTTLLHFVVQEIIRSEGVRAARAAREHPSMSSIISNDLPEGSSHDSEEHYCNIGLQVVSGLGGELGNVKKAAILDADSVLGTVAKLNNALRKVQNFLNSDMKSINEENGFHQTSRSFVQNAEVDILQLLEEEKKIMALVKSTADYFHGNAGKDEGLRLFVIVRDFLIILDKACKEVKDGFRKSNRTRKEDSIVAPQLSPPDPRQQLFSAIADRRRMDGSSSDDDTS